MQAESIKGYAQNTNKALQVNGQPGQQITDDYVIKLTKNKESP